MIFRFDSCSVQGNNEDINISEDTDIIKARVNKTGQMETRARNKRVELSLVQRSQARPLQNRTKKL